MIRRRFILGTLAIVALLPLLGIGAFEATVRWSDYPQHAAAPPPSSTLVFDRHGAPLAAFVAADEQWRLPLASLDEVSPHLLAAIVAIEDCRFAEHNGVDWHAVTAATWANLRNGSIRRGASTITMQVHRLREPAPRSFVAKLEQAIRSRQIERDMDKEQILLEYLNRAPFGGNLVGVRAVAWRYFGRSCSDLTLAEAAMLAGLPKNPNAYRPDRHPDRARSRRDVVLARMLELGLIDDQQHSEAIAEPVVAGWRPLPQHRDYGALPTLARLARAQPGRAIHTTIDRDVQRQASRLTHEHSSRLRPSGVQGVAVVVLDTATGECLAAVSLSPRPFVDLVHARRSTGSALKPFIYAAAFDAGIAGPTTVIDDSPAAWPGYAPGNFDLAFRGPIAAGDALAESRNIPALLLLEHLGPQRTVGILGAAGLESLARRPDRYGLSLAIGGAEASPWELADAYATLARGGMRIPATIEPAMAWPGEPSVVLLPRACWQTIDALRSPHRTAQISPEAAALHAAWKTGTSSGRRDAWCAAVTPRFTVVVWMGNLRGAGAEVLVGADAAAPLALQLLAAIQAEPVPWPAVAPVAPPVRHLARATAPGRGDGPRIISPAHGLQVILNDEIAPADQQVLLAAAPAGDTVQTLWWFVNNHPIGSTRGDARLAWPPTPGHHEIRVVDERGQHASVRVVVR